MNRFGHLPIITPAFLIALLIAVGCGDKGTDNGNNDNDAGRNDTIPPESVPEVNFFLYSMRAMMGVIHLRCSRSMFAMTPLRGFPL